MNLRLLSLAVGVMAVGGIAFSAAMVLVSSPSSQANSAPAIEARSGVQLSADVRIHTVAEIASVQPGADPGATGVIALRDQRTSLTSLRAPDGAVLGYERPVFAPSGVSAGGEWQAYSDCTTPSKCSLGMSSLAAAANAPRYVVELRAPYVEGEWAPSDDRFAALDSQRNLYVLGPSDTAPTPLMTDVTTFAWAGEGALLFATETNGRGNLWMTNGRAAATPLAALDAGVDRLYASPDLSRFAFGQADQRGWRLLTVQVENGAIEDFGHLGANEAVVMENVPAFSIAWSPDQRRLAVGPVTDRYAVYIVEPGTGAPPRSYSFVSGYAGELKWSPDSAQLAISTYAPSRVWHEVYLIDVSEIDAEPRFVLDGCEIVWSPTGEYIAVKREPSHAEAVAVIRVDSGNYWHMAQGLGLAPVAWGSDEKGTLQLAQQPIRRSSQLAK